MFSGPVRGGTRGGQGDFKWTDVADDKDRENYLGHSILAPVGRWQKNKDITWYNKDGGAIDEDERLRAKREEIARIKAAEEDALSAALGFKPAPRDLMSNAPETSSNAIPLGPTRVGGSGTQDQGFKEDDEAVQKRKAEKAARKAERAEKRERKLEDKLAKKKMSHKSSSRYLDPPDLSSRSSWSNREVVDHTGNQQHDSYESNHHRHRSPHQSASNYDHPSRRSAARLPNRGERRRSLSSERSHPPQESTSTQNFSRQSQVRHLDSDRNYHSHQHPDSDHHRNLSNSLFHSKHHSRPNPGVHDRRDQRSASPDERRQDHTRRQSRSPPPPRRPRYDH
ncbi:hypothetical protein PSTT_13834 [Puccinia striiformis]|uniref:Multiple myeloma tumor-associated protein 2-like N-terminal domain-containing protein n=1 Tax=Puccinia striiformis TaxID=27350 RepID=A0A2S4UQ07_9BASI|nr:hypothetical protein PSTT_13834 [Puccinia striiformis]